MSAPKKVLMDKNNVLNQQQSVSYTHTKIFIRFLRISVGQDQVPYLFDYVPYID